MPDETPKEKNRREKQEKARRQREGFERRNGRDEDDVPQETYRDGSVYEETPPSRSHTSPRASVKRPRAKRKKS
jgi:hypothetical protein